MKTDVKHCARCGGDHAGLEERPLKQPMSPSEVFWSWEYWAVCPKTGEPIMVSRSWAFLSGPKGERLECPEGFYRGQQEAWWPAHPEQE